MIELDVGQSDYGFPTSGGAGLNMMADDAVGDFQTVFGSIANTVERGYRIYRQERDERRARNRGEPPPSLPPWWNTGQFGLPGGPANGSVVPRSGNNNLVLFAALGLGVLLLVR